MNKAALTPNPRTKLNLIVIIAMMTIMAMCSTSWKTPAAAADDQSGLRSGDHVLVLAYCDTEIGARTMSMAMYNDADSTDANPGPSYNLAMSMREDCHETRASGPLATSATLDRRLWTIEPRVGIRVQFWSAKTDSGRRVFTWSSELMNGPLE